MAGLLGGFDLPPWMFNFGGDLEENRPNAMLGGSPVQGVPNPLFGDRWQPAYDAAQSGQWFASDPSYPTPEQLAPRPGFPNSAPLPPPPAYPGANQFAGQSPAMGYAPEQPRPQQPLANFPAQAPQQSGWDRFGQGINDNAMTLMGLGAGIAGGQGWGNGISQGLRMGMAGAASDRKQKNEASAQQAALQMVANATDITPQMKQALMRSPQLAQQYAEARIKSTGAKSTDIAEYEFAKAQGFKGTLEDWMKTVKQREVENFGLNPIPVLQEDGTIKYYQPGNRGSLNEMKPPGGGQIARKPREVKTDTGVELYDPLTNAHLKTVSKNVKEGAAQKEEGKIQGPTRTNMPLIETAAKTLMSRVAAVENHPGLPIAVGQYRGQAPEWLTGNIPGKTGENFRDFKELVKEVGGKVWTDAIKQMVNLGALSNAEGSRITEASARLSTIKSEKDFRVALKDITDSVRAGLENAQAIATGRKQPSAEPAAASSAPVEYERGPDGKLRRKQ